jgi:putative ABC transport system permease protein
VRLKDLQSETFLSLTANKGRSALTILGIVVGITSVIVMIGFGNAVQAYIESNISSLGANLITVMPGGSASGRIGGAGGGAGANTKSLTNADVADIKRLPNVVTAAPVTSGNYQVSAESSNTNVSITGTTYDYPLIKNVTVEYGSWFTDTQAGNSAKVAVLGPDTATTLFGSAKGAVGQRIRVSGQPFTIIGVTKAKGSSGFGSSDAVVYVPFESFQAHLSKATGISSIAVEASSQDVMTTLQGQITALLLSNHGITDSAKADFTIMNQAEISSTLGTITSALTVFLGAIAGISLVVGGIGIMNMMLTTVTERIREIGLRKALGATRTDITSQFLAESVELTMLGGLIGIAIGWLIALAVSTFSPYHASISGFSVVLAVGVSTAIGVVFGYYPARQAAKLDPIEALRYQ